MVNGNYILYGDRPSSESEVVEDHVQTRTAERKTKRKPNRTANELQNSLNMAQQLDNDTDSIKYEKKIKEPRLLRYVPTTDVSEHFVTENFETYDLKPSSEERQKRAVFTKKPKNPSDGSVNYVHSRSSSSCSSPTGNLPTISEHGEHYGTYRVRPTKKQQITDIIANNPYESKLEKYFTRPRSLKLSKGSHPDSLYRVPPDAGTGAGKLTRALRVLRWPAALLLVCGALAAFVVFLMPSNMLPGMDTANSTFWETNLMEASIGGRLTNTADPQSKTTESAPAKKHGSKTPEIDFYASDSDKELDLTLADIEKIVEPTNKKLLVAPVFPEHIAPEVQYGNEKADEDNLRSPKILLEINDESTNKPHITQKPERPLAIYFNDITTSSTETITKAETVNDVTAYDDKVTTKNERNTVSSKVERRPYEDTKASSEPTMPPAVRDYYNHVHLSRPGDIFTSGHSKFFGIGIEDAEKMQSTTQSSLYNTRVSPTLPTWRDRDDSTTKNYPVLSADAPHCRSTSLPLCRGVLPYDLAGSPASVDGKDISTLLPQIEFMVASNCSERVKQFLCSLLEPECSPAPYQPKQPCRNLCRAILDTCDGYIPRELSPAFNCRQYPRAQCSGAQVPCGARELPCGDGTCVLRDWMCDGSNDCLDGDDERHCSSCAQGEFNCGVGGCIARQWVCDGYRDCPGGDDETPRACEERGLPPRADAGDEPAGSAPAPAVRRPLVELNDARKRRTEDDSSKELLMMSDSSNALKINYTRRPSPARLTPYQPKLRTLSNLPFNKNKLKTAENASIPQPAKKQPTSAQNETKAIGSYEYKPKAKISLSDIIKPTSSNEFMEDLLFFDDMAQAEMDKQKPAQMMPKGATSRPGTREFPPEGDWPPRAPAPAAPMAAMAAMAAAAPAAAKPEEDSPTSHVYMPDTQGPMREFSPAGPPIRGHTLLDKSVNQYVKIIDGAELLRKAAEAAAAEARVAANSTYHFDEDEDLPGNAGAGAGTAHASPCPSGELRCVDGRCITLAQLCDGTIDCSDHADEDNCFT